MTESQNHAPSGGHDDLAKKLQVWERAILTQMHFAELSIKMRQIGLTLAGGALAIAILLYRTNSDYIFELRWYDLEVPVSSLLMIAAAFILLAAWIVDVGVYHKMLRGAVKFNELFEQEMEKDLHWKAGLTETITAYSRFQKPYLLEERDSEQKIWSDAAKSGDAGRKISAFYILSVLALVLAAAGLVLFHNFGGEVAVQ